MQRCSVLISAMEHAYRKSLCTSPGQLYFPQQITQADTGGCSLTLPQHCPCAAFLAKCDLQALSGLSKPHVVFLQASCSTRDSCWSPALPRGSPQAMQARCDLCQGCCAPQCCRCWRRGQGTVHPLHLGGLLPNLPSAGNSQRICLVWSAESTWGTSLSDYSSPSCEWEGNSRLHSHGCCIRVHWVALSFITITTRLG